MSRHLPHGPRFLTVAAACAALTACGSFDGLSNRMVSSITPYRVEVVQGNFVSREQVEALRPGMSREQVRAQATPTAATQNDPSSLYFG